MQALCHHRFPTNPRRSGRRSGSGIPLLSNQFVMMGSPRPARWGEYVRRRRAVREARAGTYAGDARAVRNTPVLGEPVDLQRQARSTQLVVRSSVLKFEAVKSWRALLVPLLTLVTVAGTGWMQSSQLARTGEANDEKPRRWCSTS